MAQADVPFKNKTCLTSTAIWNSCIIFKCFSTISKISVHRIRYGIKDILSGISVLLMKSVRSCRLRCLSCLRNSATKYTFPTGLWIMSVFFAFRSLPSSGGDMKGLCSCIVHYAYSLSHHLWEKFLKDIWEWARGQ